MKIVDGRLGTLDRLENYVEGGDGISIAFRKAWNSTLCEVLESCSFYCSKGLLITNTK
jgi:hypothetical protein